MESAINQIITNRRDYANHLRRDIQEHKKLIEETSKAVESLRNTRESIQFLSTQPEHDSMIPIGKLCYIPGIIKHTGEYYVSLNAHPNPYSILLTAAQTTAHLDRKIEKQTKLLQKCQEAEAELQRRLEMVDTAAAEIVSDKGVAMRVGDVYEIVEFAD